MKRSFLIGSVLGAALLFSSPVLADGHGSTKDDPTPSRMMYGQVFIGANIAQDADFTGNVGGAPQSVGVEYDTGLNIGGAIGLKLGHGGFSPRLEVEVSYTQNDVDQVFFSGNGPAAEVNVAGDSSTVFLMANALFDFKTGSSFTPYVGGGIGVAFTRQDFAYGPGINLSDNDTNFAAQAIVGVSFDLTSKTALTLDARYTRAFDVTSNRDTAAGVNTGAVSDDLDSFRVNIGMRFAF